ncbi:hypothetical protein RFI_14269 [Reticulomyxa filosa]|uniref:Uncharacterized protein n=1 Tax=Reticulomyxa filosa TaxID=46433 RepID=X6NC88_RETFI|nr:hypothetical protein RFI_14269 [Reticulomyxa filosa]|eukprot:ETO22922.1 hypothetical protein RFI_14269 [Reticulomyxa filosa]
MMKKRTEEEEKTLLSLNGEERQKYYETRIRNRERLGAELNDYLPLLAFRNDRKLALGTYLMNSDNEQEIKKLTETPVLSFFKFFLMLAFFMFFLFAGRNSELNNNKKLSNFIV